MTRSRSGMPGTRPLAASATLGLATIAALGCGVVANKIYALTLGPPGMGVITLILSIVTVGALAAGLGIGTSVVQLISSAPVSRDGIPSGLVVLVARRLTLGTSIVLAATLVIFRDEVAFWIFGTSAVGPQLLFIGPAVALTAMAYLETGILSGYQRIREIAIANVFAAGVGTILGVGSVMTFGVGGFSPAVLATAAAQYLFVSTRTRRIRLDGGSADSGTRQVALRLIRLGSPAALSQLAAAGAQLVVPVLILHSLGEREVGLYRAASTISIAYLTLVVSTLSYEYLPRVARLPSSEVGPAIDRHMRLLMGIALPLILGLFAVGPVVIGLLFSDQFSDAASILQWQLVGDLLRLPAWALAFALLARARARLYLGLEAAAGVALVIAVPLGLQLAGLEGVGMGYAFAQAIYLGCAWTATARLGATGPGRLQGVVLLAALLAAASIVVAMPPLIRGVLFGSMAVSLAAVAFPQVYRLHRDDAL